MKTGLRESFQSGNEWFERWAPSLWAAPHLLAVPVRVVVELRLLTGLVPVPQL